MALGTEVEDIDNDPDNGHPAPVSSSSAPSSASSRTRATRDDALDDAIANNRTFTLAAFFGDLNVTFQGARPELDCEDHRYRFKGDACVVPHVRWRGYAFEDPLKLKCTPDHRSRDTTLPPGLQAFFYGQGSTWGCCSRSCRSCSTSSRSSSTAPPGASPSPSSAKRSTPAPNIVGTLNDKVVTPFSDFAAQITGEVDTAEQDDDGLSGSILVKVAKKLQSFIYDGAGAPFKGLGPARRAPA